ncbi:hypothetical protein SASPL_118715 [Salvia splendens]|uniref:Uncharacterized protein n=1 Tax=Salvia splendens TaxID=180675 RepID=A0A8X8Y0W4_SALSN|nr:hypothetical protein SASPL_118715 [Salvia splendens]
MRKAGASFAKTVEFLSYVITRACFLNFFFLLAYFCAHFPSVLLPRNPAFGWNSPCRLGLLLLCRFLFVSLCMGCRKSYHPSCLKNDDLVVGSEAKFICDDLLLEMSG